MSERPSSITAKMYEDLSDELQASVAEVERLRALLRNIAGVQRGGGPCDIDTGDEVLEQAQRVHLESFDRAQKLGQARSRVAELQTQHEGAWAKVREVEDKVAKLEAENAEYKECRRSLLDQVEALKTENAELRKSREKAREVGRILKDEIEALKAKNAELRDTAKLNWSAVYAQLQVANAKLDWFEKRECEHDRLFRDGCSVAYIHAHMKQWMDANPKPSEGT